MNILTKLGFRKADEMDAYIVSKTVKLPFIFYSIVLLLWSIFDLVQTGSLTFVHLVFTSGQVIYWSSHIYYRNKTSGEYEE